MRTSDEVEEASFTVSLRAVLRARRRRWCGGPRGPFSGPCSSACGAVMQQDVAPQRRRGVKCVLVWRATLEML